MQKLREWADQQLNRNEDLLYVKEKALDELRYCIIKMKRIKIKDARIRTYNNMFQEEPKTETFEEFWAGYLGRQHQSPTKKMDEHSCKENRRKSYEHTGITITV